MSVTGQKRKLRCKLTPDSLYRRSVPDVSGLSVDGVADELGELG
jgi:hypothetical protein